MLLPGPGQLVVQIRTDPEEVEEEYAYARSHHDLRSLGFDCSGALTPSSIEGIMLGLASEDRVVEESDVDGVPCLLLKLRLVTDVDFSYWIAPQLGYSILKVRCTDDEIGLKDETQLTVNEWKDGLWFPQSYTYTRDFGATQGETEAATILINSLNEKISDEAYELTSLEIPVGKSVRTVPHPGGPKQVWDGEKAVSKGMMDESTQQTPEGGSFFLIFNIAAVFIFASVVTVRAILRRRSTT